MPEGFSATEHEQFYAPQLEEQRVHGDRLKEVARAYSETLAKINDIQLSPSELGARIGKAFVRAMQCSLRGANPSLISQFKEQLVGYYGDERAATSHLSGFMAEYTAARMLQEVGLEVYFPDTDESTETDRIDKIDWFARDPATGRLLAITVKSYLLTEDAFYDNNYFYTLADKNVDNVISQLVNDETLMSRQVNVHRAYEEARDSARSVVRAAPKYGAEPVFMMLPNANARYIDPASDISRLTGEPGRAVLNVFREEVQTFLKEPTSPLDTHEQVA